MTNFEKIILTAVGVLVVIVLVIGAIVFRQQKAINTLTGSAAGISKQLAAQPAIQTPAKKSSPPLTEVIKQFSGTIESISENQMTVNVKLPDFSKPKDPEKLKNTDGPMNITSDDFEIIDKKITVNTNEKTIFDKKPLSELKAGDNIAINADKSPYTSDTVTADKITYNGIPK